MATWRPVMRLLSGGVSAAAVSVLACTEAPLVADFALDHPAGITVVVGQQVYENCTHHSRGNDQWAWSSADTSIVTIAGANGTGNCLAIITGVSVGSTTVKFEVTANSHKEQILMVNVVAAPPTVTGITPTPPSPQATMQFTFTLTGTFFDPATIEVLGTGPGCTPCVVPNDSLTSKDVNSVTGPFTAPAAGVFTFTVRNGSGATPSTSSATVNVGAAPVPAITNVTTNPALPQARASFDFVVTGTDFNPSSVQVLATGPACSPCLISNASLTNKSATSVRGSLIASAPGSYAFSVRNGANGTPSNAFQVSVAAAPPCSNLVIADAFDVPSNWTDIVTTASAGATDVTTWYSTGGNPLGYRGSVHTIPGVGSISVMHRLDLSTSTYTPATQGVIDHIDYAEDQKAINGDAVASQFFIQQGGTTYVTALPTFSTTAWTRATLSNLTAASFTPAGLNFAGGVMSFGYLRANSNTSAQTLTREHGIDNFTVTICH